MFNTLSYARKLESTGVPREQAEAHVQIIAEIVEGDLATKQDLNEVKNELKQDLKELKSELEHKIEGMENRLLIKLGTLTTALLTIAVAIIATMIRSH